MRQRVKAPLEHDVHGGLFGNLYTKGVRDSSSWLDTSHDKPPRVLCTYIQTCDPGSQAASVTGSPHNFQPGTVLLAQVANDQARID